MADQLHADRRAQALAAHHSRSALGATNGSGRDWARMGPRWRHRLGVGIFVLVAAVVTSAAAPAESGSYPSTSGLRAEPITLVGLKATASEHVSYEPGASRTWSAGSEIVGVKVLSGRLSVHGADGERRVYTAGEGYAAGWAAYRTVNETDERVETLVTNHVRR